MIINRLRKSTIVLIFGLSLMGGYTLAAIQDNALPQSLKGKELYKQNCFRCHGIDGTRARFGAKDLKRSRLEDERIVAQIENGKGFMPSFKKKFTEEDIRELVHYVKSLRSY